MDGGHGEGRRLLIGVVQLVEVLNTEQENMFKINKSSPELIPVGLVQIQAKESSTRRYCKRNVLDNLTKVLPCRGMACGKVCETSR